MTPNITPPCRTIDVGAYVTRLINQPWARDGRHCWQLVREVQRDLFGRELPVIVDVAPVGTDGLREKHRLFSTHAELANWREVSTPTHGAVAIMSRGVSTMFTHAGVFLDVDGGGVLHTSAPHGCVFDSLLDLSARRWKPIYFVPLNA
jgi:hypothetical protein